MDFLCTDTGAISVDSVGQISLTPDEDTATVQRLRAKFSFFLGEWFRDRSQGVPYFQRILRKGSNVRVNRAIFRKILESDPGVARVVTLRYDLDRRTRELSVTFTAKLRSGSTITKTFDRFVVA